MNYIIDLLLILIVVVCAIGAAKKGLLSVAIGVCSLLLSCVLAFGVSSAAADFVFDEFLGKYISTEIVEKAEEAGADSAEDVKLPGFIDTFLGESSARNVKNKVINTINSSTEEISVQITQNAVKPAVIPLIKLVFFIIIFIALQFLFKIFKKLARYVNKIPLIGSVNSFLGGLAGIIEGIILIIIICFVISVCVKYSNDGFLIFKPEILNSTYIYRYIVSYNVLGVI